MKIKYECHGNPQIEPRNWEGTILPIRLTLPYELEVSATGNTFHLIFGAHKYGNYLCIPNWNIGTEMSSLSDRFWNYERLTQYAGLSKVDATSIADALVKLSDLV